MLDADKKEFAELLRTTMKLYRAEADSGVLRVWWNILCRHDMNAVKAAFEAFVSDARSKFQPVPADIIGILDKIVPDGRPGADAAWAMIPQDEESSCAMTEEMAEAYGVARTLLDDGDKIGARMAFRDAYNRIVESNKLKGIQPKWFPSLGTNPDLRESAMNEAVRLGRLSVEHAVKSVPSIAEKVQNGNFVIKHKRPVSEEQAMANIAKIKLLICGVKKIALGSD